MEEIAWRSARPLFLWFCYPVPTNSLDNNVLTLSILLQNAPSLFHAKPRERPVCCAVGNAINPQGTSPREGAGKWSVATRNIMKVGQPEWDSIKILEALSVSVCLYVNLCVESGMT